MKAVDKSNTVEATNFPLCDWWIRQAINRSIADQARTIRIPVQ